MAQGRRAGSAVRRYSGSGHGFGALPPITSELVFFGDLTNPNTSIISGAVATYADSSGNGRNFTQGTALNRPTYTASDATFGGRPSMTFDGVNDALLGPTFPAMSNITIFIVGLVSGYSSFNMLFSIGNIGGDAGAVAVYQSSLTVVLSRFDNPVGTTSTRTVTVGSSAERLVYAGAISAGGALWTSYRNGALSGTTVTSAAAAGGATTTAFSTAVGSNRTGTQNFNGKITDVLVYNTAMNAAQVAQVDSWLKWRNGL